MDVVTVALAERSYPIYIGPGVLDDKILLDRHLPGGQVAIITNEVVAPLYLDRLLGAVSCEQVDVYQLPDGESHKQLASYTAIVDFLVRKRHNRSTTLIALGGGVVGDITGFVAATYQRGVGFIQIPTTLLAQVDSSVGGKTAVNHVGKNMLGAFYQPKCVIADCQVLSTLPPREYSAGLAEVIKYGIIADREFFTWLVEHADLLVAKQPQILAQAVRVCCELKAKVVAEDERETGGRAILNYGHTFGHAIEAVTEYQRFLHGEAVAIGMQLATQLSVRLGRLDTDQAQEIRQGLAALGLDSNLPEDLCADTLITAMGMDKKVVDGRMRFIVANAIGEVDVEDEVPATLLRELLTDAG